MDRDISGLSLQDRERLLMQSLAHFSIPAGNDLLERTKRFHKFVGSRAEFGLWPFSRVFESPMGPRTEVSDYNGVRRSGINFSSTDYLGLSKHPRVMEAGIEALKKYGPHSAGSAVLIGNSRPTVDLEQAVADLVQMEHVLLYPTGWAAGYSSITAFVRPRDYIVMDYLSHACLQQGAFAATSQVSYFAHNDPADLAQKLSGIRAKDARNGILVVTEGLFSMDSDSPDLGALQDAARSYGATMLVDIAHDLGSMGPGGGSMLAVHGVLGKVDLVMGSFSKTFGTNGGFLATRSAEAKQFAKYFGNAHMFSTFMAPMQATMALEAIKICRSSEGDALRDRLLRVSNAIRDGFAQHGMTCLGSPSGIVPVPFNNDRVARLATRRIAEQGVFVNHVEYPAVPIGGARIRMQVMATHDENDAKEAVARIVAARNQAAEDLKAWLPDDVSHPPPDQAQ